MDRLPRHTLDTGIARPGGFLDQQQLGPGTDSDDFFVAAEESQPA
jgi:hypothetical protein